MIHVICLRQTKISVALKITTNKPIPSHFTNFKLKSIADKCVQHTAVFRLIHKDNVLYGKNISALKTN